MIAGVLAKQGCPGAGICVVVFELLYFVRACYEFPNDTNHLFRLLLHWIIHHGLRARFCAWRNSQEVEATCVIKSRSRNRHLQKELLEGLIAASNGLNSFLDLNAVYVLSGVRPIGESAVIVDRKGHSVLIVTPEWDAERASSISATDETVGTSDLPRAISDAAKKLGIGVSKTISVGLTLLGQRTAQNTGAGLGGMPAVADELIRDLAEFVQAPNSPRPNVSS